MKLHKTKEREIYYYFLKSGEKRFMYRHKYRNSLGKRKEKKKSGFKTDKAALRSLLDVKASILSGNSNHIDHSQMTVSHLLDIWIETKKRNWKISTLKSSQHIVDKHIKPLIGRYKLNKLSAAIYEREFINKKLDDGYKANSVHRYHTLFKTAINFAVDEEIILRNRFTKVKINNDEQLSNFLTPSELNIFLDHAKKLGNITEWTLTLLLAYSGMRKGEAHALKWSDVDFTNNKITISNTRDFDGIRSPKTRNSYRTIELDEVIIKQLTHYLRYCKELKLSYGKKNKEDDYVFISIIDTQPIYDNYINDFFNKMYEQIDLKEITPHGLRHTHATILIDMLIPPTEIAERLGNSLEMVYNVYAHSFKKAENKTVSAFANGLNGAKFGAE